MRLLLPTALCALALAGGPAAAQATMAMCYLQFEGHLLNARGVRVADLLSPVYLLRPDDCPQGKGEEDIRYGYTVGDGPGGWEAQQDGLKRDPRGRGLMEAAYFRAWLQQRKPPVAGTTIEDVGSVRVVQNKPELLQGMLLRLAGPDPAFKNSPVISQMPLCVAYPDGPRPVATHGAEHCKTWIR